MNCVLNEYYVVLGAARFAFCKTEDTLAEAKKRFHKLGSEQQMQPEGEEAK